MNLQHLLQRSSLYFLCSIASRLVGVALIPMYSRFLTQAEYGAIDILELTIQIMSLVIGLQSIGSALSRVFHDHQEDGWRNQATYTALALTLGANLILLVVVWPLAPALSSLVFHAASYAWLLRAGLFALLLSTVAEVALTYVRLKDRVVMFLVYTVISLVATGLLNIYFIAFLHMGAWGFVLSKLLATGAGCVFLVIWTLRDVGMGWNANAAREMWRFGSPLILANLGFFVIHFSDRFFLDVTRNLDQVAIYSLAYKFAFMVTFVVGEPFGRVWNVSLYSYTKDPNWELQFARVARYLTLALCTTSLGLCLFGPQIIRIMSTPAYFGAIALLPVLTFAYVAREVGDFFRQILYINKRSDVVSKIAMVSALLNLGLNYALIGPYGMAGAAWATLITWSFYLVVCWMRANAEHAIPFDMRSFATVMGASGAVYWLVSQQPNLPLPLDLGARIMWLLAFLGLVWVFRYLPEEELVLIRGKVGRLWRPAR